VNHAQLICKSTSAKSQQGATLIIVMIVLLIVELLGVAAAQIALMSERSARSSRDTEIALQSAEAALADAELYISQTPARFDGKNSAAFIVGCGTSGSSKGLCASAGAGKPAWLSVDFASDTGPTISLGEFTITDYQNTLGQLTAKPPRYVIELVPDTSGTQGSNFVYRVTAMGFGPRPQVQAVLQMIYRV
jgi:type IV pilus assembly protein PilX